MVYDYLKIKIIDTLKNLNHSDNKDRLLIIIYALYNYGYIPKTKKDDITTRLKSNKRIICESFVYLLYFLF